LIDVHQAATVDRCMKTALDMKHMFEIFSRPKVANGTMSLHIARHFIPLFIPSGFLTERYYVNQHPRKVASSL
jgi:hypothetical protein